MDSPPVQAAVLCGQVGHLPHLRSTNVVAEILSRLLDKRRRGSSLASDLLKVPLGYQVAALQGGKLNSSPPSLPGVAAGMAEVQPAAGISRMAANQASCPSTLQATKYSSLTVRTVQVEGATLLCDVAHGITRPLVPLVDRAAVFHAIQPGICATKRMVSACFVWRDVSKDVATICRNCQQCQRGKVLKQPAAPLHSIPVPALRFSHMHVDLVSLLPASAKGHLYMYKWVEAVPLHNTEASTCTDAFIANWVAQTGAPYSYRLCGPVPACRWGPSMRSPLPTVLKAMGW